MSLLGENLPDWVASSLSLFSAEVRMVPSLLDTPERASNTALSIFLRDEEKKKVVIFYFSFSGYSPQKNY